MFPEPARRSWPKPLLLACLLALPASLLAQDTAAPVTTEAPARQALVFRNGDLLYGALVGINAENGIQWRRSDVMEAMHFRSAGVSEIRLGQEKGKPFAPANRCLIRLHNLDELEGDLLALDAETLLLDTWYAGKINIPRSSVQTITPVMSQLATLFEGPDGVEGWTVGNVASPAGDGGQWHYEGGAFYAREAASLARDLKLPPLTSFEFELAWRGMLNLAVAIYTDSLQPVRLGSRDEEPDFGGFYSLQINSQSVSLLMVNKRDPLKHLGQAIVPAFHQQNKAQIAIKVNREQQTISFFVDGTLIKQWVDPDGFAGEGTGVRFVHQGQGVIKLNEVRVNEWDGRLEEPLPARGNSKEDLAFLLNRDRVSGQLEAIRNGKLSFVAGSNKLEIPLQRVRQIDLATVQPHLVPGGQPEAVRAYFLNRGSITFALEKWDERGVIGASPNFGRLQFDPRAFSRVELNVAQ